MDVQLVRKVAAATSSLNGVHVADHIGNGHVGSRELFDEAILAREPGDRGFIAPLGKQFPATAADRAQGMVVNLATGDVRHFGVKQCDQAAQNAALGLAAQSEEDEVVARQEGVDDLRQHGFFITVDAGEQRFIRLDLAQEVRADFILHAPLRAGSEARATSQFAKCACFRCHGFPSSSLCGYDSREDPL